MESQRVRRDLACMHSSSAVVAQGPSHPAPHGILPDQGLNALAGGFPTTGPPGTSQQVFIEPLLALSSHGAHSLMREEIGHKQAK